MKKLISTVGLFLFTIFAVTAQTQEKVTDEQLQKFAQAYQTIQQSNQEMQQKMVSAIENEGITAERFNTIYEAKMDPEKEVDASEDEMKKQEAAMEKVQKMQEDSQKVMEDKIKEKGLTMEQFQNIGAQVQQNPELQQKMQAIMMKQQTGNNPMKKKK